MGAATKTLCAVCAWLVVAIALTPDQPVGAPAKMVSSGTGFFVSKNGHLLTNFHVVDSCPQLAIQSGHLSGSARIVALDPANDLALLATNLKPVRIADWRFSFRDGEAVVVYGFPQGADRAANGTVLGLTGWHNSKLLYLERGVEPGMSGSAIVDRGGRVIGINVGDISRKIGAAAAGTAVAAFLYGHGVTHVEGSETKPLPVPEVVEKAKAISAKVICDSNGRKTDAQVCRRSGGVSASDDMIIDTCGRAIASGKIEGETLRSMYSQRAGAYLNKRQYDLAKSDCDEALKISPRDSDNFRCRAKVYAAKRAYDRAITELDEAVHLFPKDTIALSMRAGAYFSKGEFGPAIADLDHAIQIDPDYAGAISLRGTIFDNRREHVRAVADFDRAITIYDEWIKLYALPVIRAEFLTQRGNTHSAKGDRDRAIADYDQAIRLDPNNANIFYNRGTAYNAKGDRDRAIADYDRTIEINPNYPAAFYNRGNVYNAQGDRDRAIADYDQAIRLDPNNANAFNNRGNAHNAKGDRDRAIADYDQAIRLDPNNANAFYNRGNAYNARGDRDRAVADLDRAIEINPNYAAAFYNRGNAYNAKGDRDRAIADYDRAIQINPEYAAAFYNRGNAYYAKGDRDRAIADYDRAVQINPALDTAVVQQRRNAVR